MSNSELKSPKNIALISHVTFIGWIISIVLHQDAKSSLGRFYIRQTLGIHLLYSLSSICLWLIGFRMHKILFLAYIVLMVVSLLNALKEQEVEIPYIGPLFQKWFSFIE